MYEICVPVMVHTRSVRYCNDTITELKKAGATKVFLCSCRCIDSEKTKQEQEQLLRTLIPIYKQAGFTVCIWISSLGHGGKLQHETGEEFPLDLVRMVGLNGTVPDDSICPLDLNFAGLFCDWVKRLARLSPSLIVLDDDYRLAYRNGDVFCCCDLHMQKLSKLVGEPVSNTSLFKCLFSGIPNRYRTAWLTLQKDTLINFAKSLRNAVDSVDPNIRLGHCASPSTWDLDGADSIELAHAFAGDTRPFLRLIGAPYWSCARAFNSISLGATIEFTRLQQHWCETYNIEILCEGDVYPRPRYNIPSAYLEGFDMALRASGAADGILKYMLDYTSSPTYEHGYIDAHVKNEPIYNAIMQNFSNKTAVCAGVNVFEPIHTLDQAHLSKDHTIQELSDRCIPSSLRFLCDNSIPISYNESSPTVIFGDSAEFATAHTLKNGAILDIAAAKILLRRGFDVGVNSILEPVVSHEEHYLFEDEYVSISNGEFSKVLTKSSANVLSELVEQDHSPVAFTYENDNHNKFLVYTFDALKSYNGNNVFCSYCRQSQFIRAYEWLNGKKLEISIVGYPGLYILCKKSPSGLTVGIWNFSVDKAYCPIATLSDNFTSITAIQGDFTINGNLVTTSDIEPFGFVAFTVKR